MAVCVPALAVWAGLPGVVPDAAGEDEAVIAALAAAPVSAVLAVAACLAGSCARSGAAVPGCDPGELFDAGPVAVGAVAWPVFWAGAAVVEFADVPLCAFADAGAARVAKSVALSGVCAAPAAAGAGTTVLPDAGAGAVPAVPVEAACAV